MYKIDFEGPAFTLLSFAHVVRQLALAFEDLGCSISLKAPDIAVNTYQEFCNPSSYERLMKMTKNPPGNEIKIFYNFPVDMRNRCSGLNIPIVSWETTALPKSWVGVLNSQTDQIWSTSEFVSDVLKNCGVLKSKVKTLSLGFDHKLFNENVPPISLKTKKKLKLLHLGVAQPRKGTDILLEAYTKEFTNKDDICLVIKSNTNGDIGNLIQRLVSNPNCPEIEYVHASTPEIDLPRYYTACDLLVHPAHAEGAGLPVLESLACGKPVICSHWSGVTDYCTHDNSFELPYKIAPTTRKYTQWAVQGKEAWSFTSVDELRRKLRYIYNSPSVVEQKAKTCAKSVAEMTWQHIALRGMEFIKEISKFSAHFDIHKVTAKPLAPQITELKKISCHLIAPHCDQTAAHLVAKSLYSFSTFSGIIEILPDYTNVSIANAIETIDNETIQLHYTSNPQYQEANEAIIAGIKLKSAKLSIFMHSMPNKEDIQFLEKADCFISMSNEIRRSLLSIGIESRRIFTVPLFFPEISIPNTETTRRHLSIGTKNLVIGSYSTEIEKNIENLVPKQILLNRLVVIPQNIELYQPLKSSRIYYSKNIQDALAALGCCNAIVVPQGQMYSATTYIALLSGKVVFAKEPLFAFRNIIEYISMEDLSIKLSKIPPTGPLPLARNIDIDNYFQIIYATTKNTSDSYSNLEANTDNRLEIRAEMI